MTTRDDSPLSSGCEEARAQGRAYRRGLLSPEERARVDAHLSSCAGCRETFAAEAALDVALEEQLPRFAAPAALKNRLAAAWGREVEREVVEREPVTQPPAPVTPSVTSRPSAPVRGSSMSALARRAGPWLGGAAAGALMVLAARGVGPGVSSPSTAGAPTTAGASPSVAERLVAEAVNDHVRVVQSSHPVEIESGGIHQVKPWFTGKLDFAPRVSFSGDEEFPLVGGSIGFFVDRRIAVFTFKHRLHVISLLVVPSPSQGLAWPAATAALTSRGFHLRFWQRDDLGFVLVSDASDETLTALEQRLAP